MRVLYFSFFENPVNIFSLPRLICGLAKIIVKFKDSEMYFFVKVLNISNPLSIFPIAYFLFSNFHPNIFFFSS
jgi:hypothetical protein